MSEHLTCVATVHRIVRGGRRSTVCGRPACSTHDGRPWCRDHDPDAGVLRAGRRRRRTRRALERELEALRRGLEASEAERDFLKSPEGLRAALAAMESGSSAGTTRHPLDIVRSRIPGARSDETVADAVGRVVRDRDLMRSQLSTLLAAAQAFVVSVEEEFGPDPCGDLHAGLRAEIALTRETLTRLAGVP